MKIDFQREVPVALKDVPRFVPKRSGKKVHYSTVYRWTTKGVRGRVLESVMVGGIRFTTLEAIERFQQSGLDCSTSSPPTDLDAVQAALDAAGV